MAAESRFPDQRGWEKGLYFRRWNSRNARCSVPQYLDLKTSNWQPFPKFRHHSIVFENKSRVFWLGDARTWPRLFDERPLPYHAGPIGEIMALFKNGNPDVR